MATETNIQLIKEYHAKHGRGSSLGHPAANIGGWDIKNDQFMVYTIGYQGSSNQPPKTLAYPLIAEQIEKSDNGIHYLYLAASYVRELMRKQTK